jgi:predicted AAA+ superfamily ATPase
MDVKQINDLLLLGRLDAPGLFPHLEELAGASTVFKFDFGLEELPEAPGVLIVRGARQYGKSTWLELELKKSITRFGPGSAFYLNGDDLASPEALTEAVRACLSLSPSRSPLRRIFIDEITSVPDWQRAVKRLADSGELRNVLVITTGSKASDLRRASERLPGRKGRLARTEYLFTPVSYAEFARGGGKAAFGAQAPLAYALSGGAPIACRELIAGGRVPEFVIALVRDWIYGEFAASGRSRSDLLSVFTALMRFGAAPCGQAKRARESGLANNSVAQGYVELLMDLMVTASSFNWDASRNVRLPRKPCKYHFVNLLACLAWHPERIRTIADLAAARETTRGQFAEWAVAQEIWRRRAIRGDEMPEVMLHWLSKEHSVDFVLAPDEMVEVKWGEARPLEFAWFPKTFPRATLTVVNANRFDAGRVKGITLEDFLTAGISS